MKPYVIGDEAEKELIAALVYHDIHWGDSGRDLHTELLAAFEAIGRTPAAFPDAGFGNRMMILEDLPFVIYFFDQPHRVWINAIANTKQRYGYWRKRRPPRG